MVKENNRSPLTAAPLRTPGQSIDAEIQRVFEVGFEQYAVMALFLVLLAALEWWRWYAADPPQPVLFSLAAILAIIFAAWRFAKVRRGIQALRLGRDGERAVGQFLEDLRETGFKVFHDVPGNQFNVDHILIGSLGVFTVETKTISKPVRGRPLVAYDGTGVVVGSFSPDRDPIVQAKAQARWLRDLIRDSTGRSIRVQPIVVFPGWFVEQPEPPTKHEVWVLNPRQLPAILERQPTQLSSEDAKLVGFHISRYIRTTIDKDLL